MHSLLAVVARLAARDVRSTVGANLALIRRETTFALLEADRVEVPGGEERRTPHTWRLLPELQAN